MAYRLVYQDTTPEWQTYEGEGDVCVAEYEGSTTTLALADATAQAISDNGATLLSLRIWQDGLKWKTEATAHGTVILWHLIIYAIIALVVIAVVVWAFRTLATGISDIIWGPPPYIDPETGEVVYPESPWENLATIAMWGTIGLLGIVGLSQLSKMRGAKAKAIK